MFKHEERLENEIKTHAANFVNEASNRMSLITVTRAKLSLTGRRATIFVTVTPDDKSHTALDFLSRQTFDCRHYLRSHIKTKMLPAIAFELDKEEAQRQRVDKLLGH